MLKLAANLSLMFNEYAFADRFKAAKRCGFDAVEYLFPYEYDPVQLRDLLAENHLTQALFNASPGDWGSGQRGLAVLKGHEDEFYASIEQAITFANVIGNDQIHVMAGVPDNSCNSSELKDTYLKNICWAADQAKSHDVSILIEPINTRDMPGYYLNTPEQALAFLTDANRENLGLQFDLYHAQIMGGDLIKSLEHCWSWIKHIQIASVPHRHEPLMGEVNYPFLFQWLEERGYDRYVGCEYRPINDTESGLEWFEAYRKEAGSVFKGTG